MNKIVAMVLCGATLLALPCVCQAGSPPPPAPKSEYDTCLDKSGGITSNMLDCDADEFDRQDKLLNAVYVKLMATLDDHSKDSLRQAERAWVPYRDAECDFESAFEDGGTMATLEYQSCLIDMTKDRREALEASFKLYEDLYDEKTH